MNIRWRDQRRVSLADKKGENGLGLHGRRDERWDGLAEYLLTDGTCLLARAFLLSLSIFVLWSLWELLSAAICKIGGMEECGLYICCRRYSINLAASTTSLG